MPAEPVPAALPAPGLLDPRLLDKARAVSAQASRLKRDFDGAHRLAHDAQVREALVRSELTLALNEALIAGARTQARLRDRALAAYAAGARRPLRRHNRISQLIDRVLSRLGARGQALVIARSGVWRDGEGFGAILAYVRRGADPRATPASPLDQAWYLKTYPDVARRRISPLVHYLVSGGREGRAPGPVFDDGRYRAANAGDLAATSLTSLEHYIRVGAAGGQSPHPLFDPGHYLAQDPALAPGEDPLSHYLREGGRLGFSPHPLIDPAWYEGQAPDSAGQPALSHYLTEGWRQDVSPHPLFDAAWYRRQGDDVNASGMPPLVHFMLIGGFEGRSPSPWFDTAHYLELRGAALPAGVNPLVDYLRGGAWDIAEVREGFPTAAYLASRPDIVRAGVTPLEHWVRQGGR